jgi:hypothetical protein
MTEQEREIMTRHAVRWQPWIDSGQMVIFGSMLGETAFWGMRLTGVVAAPASTLSAS